MLGLGLSGLNTIIAMLSMQLSCADVAVWHYRRGKAGKVEQNVCKEILMKSRMRD